MTEMYLKLEGLDDFANDLKEELDRRLPSVSRYEDVNLHILLPKELKFNKKEISKKIQRIVEKRTEILEFEYLLKRRQGRQNLTKGILLFFVLFSFAYFFNEMNSKFMTLVSETLTIAVWVAFWKPLETYIFDLPKLKLLLLNYRKLISAEISFEEIDA